LKRNVEKDKCVNLNPIVRQSANLAIKFNTKRVQNDTANYVYFMDLYA